MKKCLVRHPIHLVAGELYLFHPIDRQCPASSSLWGVFDKRAGGTVYLESSSRNLREFRIWHDLPERYRYIRCATHDELRDYFSSLTCYECRRSSGRQIVRRWRDDG